VELVKFLAGTEPDIEIVDMHDPIEIVDMHDPDVVMAAGGYGICHVPAIVIDGKLAEPWVAVSTR
jgi:hypothetical protein